MALSDLIASIFGDEEERQAFEESPTDYLSANGFGDASVADVDQAMNQLAEQSNDSNQGASSMFSGGNVTLPPPSSEALDVSHVGGDGVEAAAARISNYYNVTNSNESTTYDNDVDNSQSANVNAFGSDVDLDFENDADVLGDGAVLAEEGAQVQTGDGVMAGDDLEGTVNTGSVGGDMVGDAGTGNTIGDGNLAVDGDGNMVGDGNVGIGGDVGTGQFGDGNVAMGDVSGTAAVGGDATSVGGHANFGEGEQTVVDDSTLSETGLGGSTVTSNDVAATAEDGGAISFGSGEAAGGADIDAAGGSTVTTADDGATAVTDQSTTVDASTETTTDISVDDSGNTTQTYEETTDVALEDSLNTTETTTYEETTDVALDDSLNTTEAYEETTAVDDHSVDTAVTETDVAMAEVPEVPLA
jgi:hypothetical protein